MTSVPPSLTRQNAFWLRSLRQPRPLYKLRSGLGSSSLYSQNPIAAFISGRLPRPNENPRVHLLRNHPLYPSPIQWFLAPRHWVKRSTFISRNMGDQEIGGFNTLPPVTKMTARAFRLEIVDRTHRVCKHTLDRKEACPTCLSSYQFRTSTPPSPDVPPP